MGLKNAGATCYMNAVFQQLFMQPTIRALVLSAKEESQPGRDESAFYQLQVGYPTRDFFWLCVFAGLRNAHFYIIRVELQSHCEELLL